MAQNIYDTPDFFAAYSKYPRAVDGLSGASEWPRLKIMLPASLQSRRVLDLGCGDGWFCRWARGQGAAEVHGLDVSQNMLERAARLTGDDGTAPISFARVDLEAVRLPAEAYDLVFSGLALHYVEGLEELLRQVQMSLVPGGRFVFSVEHPVFTAPLRPGFIDAVGVRGEEDGDRKQWPLDSYFSQGGREVSWLVDGVRKQHRTMGAYIEALLRSGFELEALDEWGRTEETGRMHPDWPNEGVCPRFLLVGARKRESRGL
ncbi:Methylase [Pleurostoma richardsiae]|uniref:Methylase n=1 Tax=Pleurostoma richardsiae TaxID=41990 RepID=A0AA38RGR7_9PEZI|nr:Methylase [Pleurostoma richardsiae]